MGMEISYLCRSVYIFAKKTGIPFEFKKVSLMAGEQYGEEFSKINILRKAPAIKDGDFCLAESIVIRFSPLEPWQ